MQCQTNVLSFYRVTEELKETHMMYLDDSKTYTLLEFKNVLIHKNEECLLKLTTLSQYHADILNAVFNFFKTLIAPCVLGILPQL